MKRLFFSISLLISFMTILAANADGYKWIDASSLPIFGKISNSSASRYCRLPDSLQRTSRASLWDISRNSAGLFIRFRSDASKIKVEWDVWLNRNMNHMTSTGIRGLDLYCLLPDGSWTFVNSARPGNEAHNSASLISDMSPIMREYKLYLPLYDECTSLKIGVDSAAVIEKPAAVSPVESMPIVWYGTSILQGGCASRPGMVVTSILERWLNREFINLGFSGNAQLDIDVANVIADSPASLIILDFLPNVTTAQLNERTINFYKVIRAKHPLTPIVFIESPRFPIMRFNNVVRSTINEKNEALKANFDKLIAAGEKNIYFISSEKMLGDDFEATVDCYHFTDLGFIRYAEFMLPFIKNFLKIK